MFIIFVPMIWILKFQICCGKACTNIVIIFQMKKSAQKFNCVDVGLSYSCPCYSRLRVSNIDLIFCPLDTLVREAFEN